MGNEEADLAARQAISEGVTYNCLPLHSEVLEKVKRSCKNMWREYFDERSLTKGIWYKTIQCRPPRAPWFTELQLTRKDIVVLMRLRSGHIPSNKFKYLMGLAVSPKCPECDMVDDVQHVLMECVRSEAQRLRLGIERDRNVGSCNSLLACPASAQARLLIRLYTHVA